MPIYEYKCENEHVFDVMQRMSEDPLTDCIECGVPVRKVLQPVGISFKGSGFYSTDYSKQGPKSEPKEAKASEPSDKNGASEKNGASDKAEKTTTTATAKKSD